MILGLTVTLGNGVDTKAQGYTPPPSLTQSQDQYIRRRSGDFNNDYGLHEPWEWYDKCYVRERNKGKHGVIIHTVFFLLCGKDNRYRTYPT